MGYGRFSYSKVYLPIRESISALQHESWGYLPLDYKGWPHVWNLYFVTNYHINLEKNPSI